MINDDVEFAAVHADAVDHQWLRVRSLRPCGRNNSLINQLAISPAAALALHLG
jgi:hypothetical protein